MINQKFNCVLNTKFPHFSHFLSINKKKRNNRSLKGVLNKTECDIVCYPIKSVLFKQFSFAIVYDFFFHILSTKPKWPLTAKKSDIDFGKCPTIHLKSKKKKTKLKGKYQEIHVDESAGNKKNLRKTLIILRL